MNMYLVEHDIPGGIMLTVPELEAISQQSQLVVQKLDRQIQLVSTTITDDRMVCLYRATDEALVREFSRQCGLPIRWISKVSAVIGPDVICSV